MTNKKDIIILAVESSCDETSAALVKNGREVLSNIISSQINIHKRYGGVVPEIASRKHIEVIDTVIKEALDSASKSLDDIDSVAVTCGPGLVGALLVGLSTAKALSFAIDKPLIGVHHIEGHIAANYIENPKWEPPFICLVVSGGHTNIVIAHSYDKYEVIGSTRDDAAGEAFDKTARALNLSYPGGPQIEKLAYDGNPNVIAFPRVMIDSDDFDFSFSGLKSAVLNYINKCKMKETPFNRADVAASLQQAITDVLCHKAIKACKKYSLKKLAMAGGVCANSFLRRSMEDLCLKNGIELNVPKPVLCTDNAAMIGSAAYYRMLNGDFSSLSLNAFPSLRLGENIPNDFKANDIRNTLTLHTNN